MQARGRVSIGEHAAERADYPWHSQANQPAQAAFCTTEPHPTASASRVENFVVRQFARNGEPLTVTS